LTKRQLSALLAESSGYGKTDADFTALMQKIQEDCSLFDGDINYNTEMTSKRYFFRVTLDAVDKYGDWCEGETIAHIVVYKCFTRGLDDPYEIMGYVT